MTDPNITEEVHFEMLEKKSDGSFKAKYPKVKSKSGVTFDEHLADNTPHDGFVVPISHLNESSIKHITESGSNANGSYIKFDDGTMICVSTTRNVTNISSASGGVFRSPMSAWTLPATFINTDYIFTGSGNPAWVGLGGTKDTTSISYYAYSSTSLSEAVAVNLLAIGRWK